MTGLKLGTLLDLTGNLLRSVYISAVKRVIITGTYVRYGAP